MNPSRPVFTNREFAKTFVLPALMIFVIPILACLFFWHAQANFDAHARESILNNIKTDSNLSEDKRAALIAYFEVTPFSQYLLNEGASSTIDPTTRFNYATFRWMIRISAMSVVIGIAVFLLAGLCVWLSLRSQLAQYWCLLISWHVLRIYGALQTIVLGILVVELSFWVTALWLNSYDVRLIIFAGLLSLGGIVAVIKAIFTTPKSESSVEGTLLDHVAAGSLWQELNAICAKVGTNPPDQVIAGIDDNFFVTEQPIVVNGTQCQGKTLFVSLPLLKQLSSSEADAILAHEMAHFSGEDTLYSRRISPLLSRYESYLYGLHSGFVTKPVFYFMICFRALFEVSLGKLSRHREFRADRIAASITSERDFSSALLRTAAYSKFRRSIEMELFSQQRALETVDVSDRIERGFAAYIVEFASDPEISAFETVHPFDSHPPMSQRLIALGIELSVDEVGELLAVPGDGGWYQRISVASDMERQQWQTFEERFRDYHQQSLAYRLLPETAEEQAIVEVTFPRIAFNGADGVLTLDLEKVQHASWRDAIYFREFLRCEFRNDRMLEIFYFRIGELSRDINVKKFDKKVRQEFLTAFQRYYGRYLAAVEYQKENKAPPESQVQTPIDEVAKP